MVDDPTDAEPAAPATSTPRKKVVSKRVTPKGGPAVRKTPTSTTSRSTKSDDDVSFSSGRYTPPSSKSAADLPSPWWVPTLMFGLLILGALVIIVNYMGVLGDASNLYLILGLGLILGGIVAATQYR